MKFARGSRIIVMRSIPYPPSFSRMAASTIEPAIGASTWALGNHRCRPYRGILTKSANIYANHRTELLHMWVGDIIQY